MTAVQPRFHPNYKDAFYTQIGSIDPKAIKANYEELWNLSNTGEAFQFIGVPKFDKRFKVHRNLPHMLDFMSSCRMPMTLEFHMALPPDAPEFNPLFPVDRLHMGAFNHPYAPPFRVSSAATGPNLVTTYRDDQKGWISVLANTFGQPVFIMIDTPLPDCYIHVHAYTRYFKDQDPWYFKTSLEFKIPVRIAPYNMDVIDRAMELTARVNHKQTFGILAHVTVPGSFDMEHRTITNTFALEDWKQFNSIILSNSRHLVFKTGENGILDTFKIDYVVLDQFPPHFQASIAVLMDYFQDVTTSDILDFVKCCKTKGILFPLTNLSLQAYTDHLTTCKKLTPLPLDSISSKPPYAHSFEIPSMAKVFSLISQNAIYRIQGEGLRTLIIAPHCTAAPLDIMSKEELTTIKAPVWTPEDPRISPSESSQPTSGAAHHQHPPQTAQFLKKRWQPCSQQRLLNFFNHSSM